METIPKWPHKKYHTMGTIPKWPHKKLPHNGNNSKIARKNFRNMEPIPKRKNKKKYHSMGTIPKWPQFFSTLWEQFQNDHT